MTLRQVYAQTAEQIYILSELSLNRKRPSGKMIILFLHRSGKIR